MPVKGRGRTKDKGVECIVGRVRVPARVPGEATASVPAHEAISAVVAWYSRQLMEARRAGDQQRLEEPNTLMQGCAEDRRRPADAPPEESERISALYTERLRGPEPGES